MERPAKRIHLDNPEHTRQAINRLPQPGRVTTEISLEDQQVLRRAAEILGTTVHELPHKIPSALNEASENVLPTPASQPGTLAYAPAFQVASSQQADEDLFRNTDFSWPADFYSPMSGHGVPVSDTCFRLFEPAYDSSQMPHPPAFYPSHAQPQFQVDRDSAGWDSPLDVFASSQYASGDMQFPPQQGANSMNWNSAPGGNSLLESWLLNPDPASLRAFEPLLNDTAAINSDSYGTLTDARVSSSALASAPTGPPATGVHASKSNADNSGNNNLVLELATSDSLSGTEQGSSATEHSGSGTERGRSKGLSARPGSASASHESSRSPVPEPRAENWSRQPRRRGPFHDPVEREQTGLTRQLGACIRCRIQKARCIPDPANLYGSCLTCKMVTETALSRPICVRKKVTEAKLFAKGDHPQFRWSRRWKSMKIVDIKDWASSVVRTITVTQDVAGLKYDLPVRQFNPVPGDSLRRSWSTRGVPHHYDCTNYAIEDMKEAGRNLEKFVDSSIGPSIDYYIDKSDSLLHQTYHMALKHSREAKIHEERSLIRSILRLWVSIRMESRSERICGSETLGMKPQDWDPECPNYRQILVPPVMSAQIELIATATVLNPTRKKGLMALRELIEKKRTASWFTIYLCIFILLHSCALLTEFENRLAKKYGLKSRFVYEDFVKELHHGSTILLSYFHYCLKGSYPLLMDWSSSMDTALAQLTPDQIAFLQESAKQARSKEAHFQKIRANGEFEDGYFFLAQLFENDWSPDGFQ